MKIDYFDEIRKQHPGAKFGEGYDAVTVTRKVIVDYNIEDHNNPKRYRDGGWEIYLEHSCDEWIIGDAEEAKEMVVNIQCAIEYCETHK